MKATIVFLRVRCSSCNQLFDYAMPGRVMKCPHCGETHLRRRGEWVNARCVQPRSKPAPAMYGFNWVGGGYNQVTASTKREALKLAKEFGTKCGLEVNPSSFKRYASLAEQNAYWRSHYED